MGFWRRERETERPFVGPQIWIWLQSIIGSKCNELTLSGPRRRVVALKLSSANRVAQGWLLDHLLP